MPEERPCTSLHRNRGRQASTALGQIVEQRCSARVIADLTSGHEEAQRATVRVGDGVELRVHAALGATDEPPEIPFLTRRLDAVQCALK